MIRAAAGWPDGVDTIPWAAQSLSGPRAKKPGRTQGFPQRRGPVAGSSVTQFGLNRPSAGCGAAAYQPCADWPGLARLPPYN